MDWKRCNLQILCAFRFSVYYLRVTTKLLNEMTQRACVVFVPSLTTDVLHGGYLTSILSIEWTALVNIPLDVNMELWHQVC